MVAESLRGGGLLHPHTVICAGIKSGVRCSAPRLCEARLRHNGIGNIIELLGAWHDLSLVEQIEYINWYIIERHWRIGCSQRPSRPAHAEPTAANASRGRGPCTHSLCVMDHRYISQIPEGLLRVVRVQNPATESRGEQ